MNRRDMILGSAAGLAAASAAAAQTRGAKASSAATAAPGATKVAKFYGQTLDIMFTTSTDLTGFMPAGLLPVDPHRGFIKAERIKIRTPETDAQPAGFSQYQQICITTMAQAPGFGPRHRNILMWEDRPWAIGSSMVAVKRFGIVEMTQIFEPDHVMVGAGEAVPFYLDIQNYGHSMLSFAGKLDGKKRVETPAYGGFYVGGEPGADLKALTLDNFAFTRPLYGTGTLTFGQAPNEQASTPAGAMWPATLIKDVQVEGCVFQDFGFQRTYGADFKIVRKG